MAPVHDEDFFRLGELVLRIYDAVDHEDGLFVEVGLVSWDSKESRDEINHVTPGDDTMLHLCKDISSCKGPSSSGSLDK